MTRKSAHTDSKLSAIVELAEVRTHRTMAAAQARLLPDETAHLEAEEMARRVAAQLSALPQDERHLLRREILVTVHDLEGLIDALQSQMNELSQELRKVSSHTSAATAYGRTGRTAAHPGKRP